MRVTYIVTTTGKYHDTRVRAITESWAADRKGDVLFMSDAPSSNPAVLNLECGSDYTSATIKALKGLWVLKGTSFGDSDWVVVCDDDSLMLPDRIDNLLRDKDPRCDACYGCRINTYPEMPELFYPQGGAGYAISKALLQKMFDQIPNAPLYSWSDVTIGVIIKKLGVEITHVQGFYSNAPEAYAATDPGVLESMFRHAYSFHYIQPETMGALFQKISAIPHQPIEGSGTSPYTETDRKAGGFCSSTRP